jgi:hypothetical protein
MSGDELRVTTAHLGHLSMRQADAAADTRSAMLTVAGVDAAVRSSHGVVASASSDALDAVLAARRSAATKMAAISDELCHKLSDAAQRYELVDDATGGALNTQLQAW